MLNIGLGCGKTLQKILDATDFQKVDVVEINPEVVEATKKFSKILDQPRVNLIIDDGLKYLRQTDKKYDLIIMEIDNPTVAYSSPLYPVEAFSIFKKSLSEEGVLSIGVYGLDQKYIDILSYSLKEVYSYVYVQSTFFIGSQKNRAEAEHVPSTSYEINTLDKNTLLNAYED